MPPKPKFSKEEIIDAALDIVSRDGVAALTARELGEKARLLVKPDIHRFQKHGRGHASHPH